MEMNKSALALLAISARLSSGINTSLSRVYTTFTSGQFLFICLPNLIHRSIYQTSFTSHSPTEALQLIGNQTCLKQASQLLSITNEVILRRIVTNLIHCTPLPELGDTVMITVNEMSFVSSWYLE